MIDLKMYVDYVSDFVILDYNDKEQAIYDEEGNGWMRLVENYEELKSKTKIGDKIKMGLYHGYWYYFDNEEQIKQLQEELEKYKEQERKEKEIKEKEEYKKQCEQFLNLSEEKQYKIVLEDLMFEKAEEIAEFDTDDRRDFKEEYGSCGKKGIIEYFEANGEEVEDELNERLEECKKVVFGE